MSILKIARNLFLCQSMKQLPTSVAQPKKWSAIFILQIVTVDGHYLQYEDGTPFFWLGDTGWELFHRLTKEEIARYLENRHQKGFTVIQAVILAEFNGLRRPNQYGDLPLID